MTRYLMSDVTGFTVPAENGGCGQPHSIEVNEQGVRALDCPACESAMQNGHGYGHAPHPKAVLATPDEIAEQERDEKDAQKAGMRRLASWQAEAAALQAGGVPQVVLDQMAAMAAQIAELTAKLEAAPSAPADDPAAPADVEQTPAETPASPPAKKAAPRKAATPPAQPAA